MSSSSSDIATDHTNAKIKKKIYIIKIEIKKKKVFIITGIIIYFVYNIINNI